MIRPAPLVLIAILLAIAGCDKNEGVTLTEDPEANLDLPTIQEDIKVGDGPPAEEGDLIIVEYVGTFEDTGATFDQNANVDENGDRIKAPFTFLLGGGQVIVGWDEGIVGMRKGGERKLTVPWQKAYGVLGDGNKIPGKSVLVFEVKLLDIIKSEEHDLYDVDDTVVGTGREAKEGDTIMIHYRGTYSNGMQFDNSRERGEEEGGEPWEFTIGLGHVITGIDVGVRGMRVGGKRTLRLPPTLVGGTSGMRSIQGNQVCYFDIELLAIK